MGSNVSKNALDKNSITNNNAQDRSNKICIDCQKDKQVDYPEIGDNSTPIDSTTGTSAATPNPCNELYHKVDLCMKSNQGQISSCVNEWKDFNECFTREKDQRQRNVS